MSAQPFLIGALALAVGTTALVAFLDRAPATGPRLVTPDALPAPAQSVDGDAIRGYILSNPEVIREAMVLLEQKRVLEEARADEDRVTELSDAIYNDGFSHVGGNPNGSVTIVEFQDYRCGYCKRAHGELKDLVDVDGDIRLIVKEFPILGEDSLLTSQLAIAAKISGGDAAYAGLHDLLMTYGGPINDGALTKLAERVDLDLSALREVAKGDEVARRIAATHQLGRELDISGTPTFIVGGKMVRGYIPQAEMQKMVDLARDLQN